MIETPSPRIVSLLPAATEIVASLGLADYLVGRSHECDYPESVSELTICTKARLSPTGTSREIDDAVKDALKNALSIYEVLEQPLADASPDIIVTQDQCEVCAVALGDVEVAAGKLIGTAPSIVSLNPVDLDHVFEDIRNVAKALEADAKADEVINEARRRLSSIKKRTNPLPTPSVCCVEWAEPLMAAGNWVPELVEIAGGEDLFGMAGTHAPWLETDDLLTADPDVIVFMPCGFGLERSASEAKALAFSEQWQSLSAVKSGRVYATDGNSFFNRPSPRLVESAEILAEIFYPSHFEPRHADSAWVRIGEVV